MDTKFGQDGPCHSIIKRAWLHRRLAKAGFWLLLLGLFAGHAWLTLLPVGGWHAWNDSESSLPMLQGRHPLHLYHSILGARGLVTRGNSTCIDPHFHAGYPKTPVFDSGSRFSERMQAILMLLKPSKCWVGCMDSPAADIESDDPFGPWQKSARTYLRVWFLALLSVPAILFGIVWALRRDLPLAVTFVFLGLLVWWSPASQEALANGNADWLFGGLLLALCHAFFVRYHQGPSLLAWLFLTAAGLLAILVQPVFMILGAPFFLGYYMRVGPRHEWIWHAGLWTASIIPFLVHCDWLTDWVGYWWIRQPASLELVRPGEDWLKPWKELVRIGDPASGPLFLLVGVLFLLGWGVLHFLGSRALGRAFAFVVASFLGLAGLGFLWEPARRLEVEALFFTAVWFSLFPAAFGLCKGCELPYLLYRYWSGQPLTFGPKGKVGTLSKALGFMGIIAAIAWAVHAGPRLVSLGRDYLDPDPLKRHLNPLQTQIIELLRTKTTSTARILWEDGPQKEEQDRWTALLPLWTNRTFMGGLDAWAGIEHLGSGLVDGNLVGTPMGDLENRDLANYFETFNIGWVVCRSSAAKTRLDAYPEATLAAEVGYLSFYVLNRPHSFVLRGQAEWLEQSSDGIVLANLQPVDGQVVLSLHYHSHWEAIPSRITIERELDPRDPIPLVRLKLDGPVSRLVLRYRRQ